MSIYQKFFNETVDENGKLIDLEVHYPENFNFGYDVIDEIAAKTPDKRALVWCNTQGEEHIFSFSDIFPNVDLTPVYPVGITLILLAPIPMTHTATTAYFAYFHIVLSPSFSFFFRNFISHLPPQILSHYIYF